MPILTAGSNITLTLTDYDTVYVEPRNGAVQVDAVSGLGISAGRIGEITYNRSFGPYTSGQLKLTATLHDAYYDVVDGVRSVSLAAAQDSSGNYTGLSVNGVLNPLAGPSSKYKFFVPAQQFIGSGVPKDKSSNAAVLSLRSLTDAQAWANPGYLTTVAGSSSQSVSVPTSSFSFDLSTQSVIFSMRMKKVATVGSEIVAGCADAASTQGFYLSMRAASGGVSKVRPVLNTSGGVVSGLADSTAAFGEASATDHVITLAIDAPTKSVFLYCDGTLSNTYSNAYTGSTSITVPFALGAANGSAGTPTSVDMQCSGIHFLSWTGGLPLNIGSVVQLLAANPHRFLTDADLQF